MPRRVPLEGSAGRLARVWHTVTANTWSLVLADEAGLDYERMLSPNSGTIEL